MDLFGKTRVAEAASYAQIASERVRVLDQLDNIIFDTARDEAALQRIITEAPWLVQPDWTVITANQSLKHLKTSFENYLKREHGIELTLVIEYENKRPDFTLVAVGGMLHFVEIKASGHALDDEDLSLGCTDTSTPLSSSSKATLTWRPSSPGSGASTSLWIPSRSRLRPTSGCTRPS